MSNNPADVIALARTQLGYREGYSNGHWNNIEKYAGDTPGLSWANGQAWCAVFVSWLMYKNNVIGYKSSASVAAFRDYYKSQNRFSEYPAIGAVVIYGRNGNVHTGIVTGYNNTFVYDISGNTNTNGSAEGDGVYAKAHSRRDPYVYGYGLPQYDTPYTSADPKFNGKILNPNPPIHVKDDFDMTYRVGPYVTDKANITVPSNTAANIWNLLAADNKVKFVIGSFRYNPFGTGRVEIWKIDNAGNMRDGLPIAGRQITGNGLTNTLNFMTTISGNEKIIARVYATDVVTINSATTDIYVSER